MPRLPAETAAETVSESIAHAPVRALAICAALVLGSAGPAHGAGGELAPAAPSAPSAWPPLRPAATLAPAPDSVHARERPIVLRADDVQAQAERELTARGGVELRRAGLVLEADWLRYDLQQDLAEASGRVRVQREDSLFSGPRAQLNLQRMEGWFLEPSFEFLRAGSGGRAARVEFLGEGRMGATAVQYTSCPRDGSADPAWLLTASRVDFDNSRNEGIAEGAVLRFLGVPILALPRMSFPITGARKSGWLPPSVNLDNRSGLDLSLPWYWNLAPNRDATLAPRLSTRRGAGLDAEFRYLEPDFSGELALRWLPHDQVEGRSRHALKWRHDADLPGWSPAGASPGRLQLSGERVSDDGWWRDFPRATAALTPRLLPLHAGWEQPWQAVGSEGLLYLRTTRWQVMQTLQAPIAAPHDRALQLGAQWSGAWQGWEVGAQTELNRFTLSEPTAGRPTGWRTHALLGVSRPWREPGFWVVPRLGLNTAGYDLEQPLADGRRRFARTIPTASLDLGLELERDWQALGRSWRQTLEPRVLAVYTPWRAQDPTLSFDSAGKDFGFSSIFSDNDFSGIDRVSDARQVNLGLTTRLVDAQGGRELLRLGAVQRYLLAEQRITVEGTPYTRRFSDFIVLGSTTAVPNWVVEGSVRYNADIRRPVRSLVSASFRPGEFRTLSATYRFARGSSEQLELGWQWPLARLGVAPGVAPSDAAERRTAPSRCSGQLYGVGRVNYSVRDSRVTDSILGLEFDAGCWIGRVVVERLSTGRTEATTRLMLQLELVGLSLLGSNPLRVLKDNIPGYQLLREPRGTPTSPSLDSP